jgi:amino acid permease
MTEPLRESDPIGDESGAVETELSRDMSLADITFISIGVMIGVGVFDQGITFRPTRWFESQQS